MLRYALLFVRIMEKRRFSTHEGRLPMDLHHNLFYSYRGPNTDDRDRERQLENNITKALVNTLRLGGETVWRPFLAEFGVTDARDAAFLLQRRDLASGGAAQRRCRVLLGIATHPSQWSPTENAMEAYESIPDAWIYGDGFAVLVESKVSGDFSDEQMQGHLARLQSTGHSRPAVVLKTWREVHRFFHQLSSGLTSAPALLVQQFIQFLEYSDVSGFNGFRCEHFDYFLSHDDHDARLWGRGQMTDFAERVQKQLCKSIPFYSSYDVGTLKQSNSYCWVAFGPADGKYRKLSHQTISISSDGLRVFINSELKSATDRIKAVLSQSAHALRAVLQDLHAYQPFELVLQERKQVQASLYENTPKMRLHSSLLADESVGGMAWMAFAETVQRIPLPYLCLTRRIPPRELLDLPADDASAAVRIVVEMFEQNHAVVELLNGTAA